MARLQAQPLYWWGVVNIFGLLAIMFLHPFLPVQHLYRLHFISVGMWLLAAWGTNRAPLRLPAPILVLLAMALWFYICTILAQGTVWAFFTVADNGLYEWPWLVLNFLMGSSLAYFAPEARGFYAKIVVGIAISSCAMALLQFLDFGPAITAGALFRTREIVAGVQVENAAVRASGLLGVGQNAIMSIIASMILMGPLLWRKVPWWHIAIAGFLLFASLLGQVRSTLPMLGLGYLAMSGLLLYRYGGRSRIVTVLVSIAMLIPVMLALPRMAYITELFDPNSPNQRYSNTFAYRRDNLWPQITVVLTERPWTGIGYHPQLYGSGGPATRRTSGLLVDGGYHLSLGVGGYPGLAMLIMFLITAIATLWRAYRTSGNDPQRTPLLLGLLLVALSMPIFTLSFITGYQTPFSGLTYLVAGFAMTSAPALAGASTKMDLLTFHRRKKRNLRARPLVPGERVDEPT